MKTYILNPRIQEMRCLKCGQTYPVGDYFYGCPHCLKKGENASLTFVYEGSRQFLSDEKGLNRYSQFLPYKNTPYLGEGNTPVLSLNDLAKDLQLGGLYTKNEFQNPTASHKDRMNPFIVARAVSAGFSTITCASSGNEAASLAAYAAAQGLRCVNVSSKDITKTWRNASDACGAEMILTETSADRLSYQKAHMDEGWYCATNLLDIPTSSSPFGIQGYKTISYELYEEFGDKLPDCIMIPTCRGDLLYGIYEGFKDLMDEGYLTSLPRLAAAEPIPRLELILDGRNRHQDKFPGDSSQTPSIGGGTATYQSELALRDSGGFAVSSPGEDMREAVKACGKYGFYLETSSAILINCLKKAISQEKIQKGSRVLLVLTSSGYKNPSELFD
ncbi:MAG: pyridoxal-phosphate dependent enzyme [Blautia sp.]|nr:pyridoxal-phosphate dependent enzyme [Blautia sp.]